ncbi:MAG: TonB-dependent receptor [Acidobacteria bacterium]|nr:TonB-dependent receptor [Acidobacteriota bacterium]MCI0720802.1 TonB-dependent receptor [Acidobacteriota bacterium]
MKLLHHFLVASILCFLGSVSVVLSQGTTASIVGEVYDPSEAVVPGAEVRAVHVGTGTVRTALTSEAGRYVFRNLQIGRYTVSVEVPGFKKAQVSDVTLLIDQTAQIDLHLQAGEITETVNVEGSILPLLNTTTSDVGEVVQNQRIVELPLNAREFLMLTRLSPGVTGNIPGALASLQGEWAGFNASGLRQEFQMVSLHGIINVDPQNNALGVRPSVDAIQEFKIQTTNFSAELPSKGGAVVNIAIKSGTNKFHGSLFEFNRNSAFSARNFFDGQDRKVLNQNQFGGTVGGPVFKNQTFFFAAYEGRKIRRPQTDIGTMPTSDQRRGIFDPGLFGIIYDPLTWDPNTLRRQPFPENRIPADRINPVSQKVLEFVSLPNKPGVVNNINRGYSFADDLGILNARFDHHFGDKDVLMFNFNINDQTRSEPGSLPPLLIAGFGEGVGGWNQVFDRGHYNLTYTRFLSPAFTNEFRAGAVRAHNYRLGRNTGKNFAKDIFNIPGSEPRDTYTDFPQFSVAGYHLPRENVSSERWQGVFQAGDHLTWIRRNHSFKTGFDFFLSTSVDLTCNCAGAFTFSGQYVSAGRAAPNADAFAQFLLGYPNNMERIDVRDKGYFYGKSYGMYFQDDWRVTNRLTFNLGLRYDFAGPIREKNNHMANFDPSAGQVVYPRGAVLEDCDPVTGICKPFVPSFPFRFANDRFLYESDKGLLAPRFGFAYQLTPKIVLRSAYGIFTNNHHHTRYEVNSSYNVPWRLTPRIITDPDVPNARLDIGFQGPHFARAASPLLNTPRPIVGWRNSYAQMWNLGFQIGLTSDMMLDLAYVGTKGTHATARIQENLPLPGPGIVDSRRPVPSIGRVEKYISDLNSHYHSFQAKLNRRFAKRLALNVAYTLSKAIDNNSADVGTLTDKQETIENPFLIRQSTRGLSGFDLPQVFVFNYIWELPGPQTGFLKHLAAGWQMTGIWTMQSGWPFTVDAPSRTNNGTGSRPDRICDGALGNPTVARWFDTSCFVTPEIFTYGNSGRNILRTDGVVNVDAGLSKSWPLPVLGEGGRLQFRAEFFNLFNHANFGPPARVIGTRDVGSVTTAAPGRELQFGLKVNF